MHTWMPAEKTDLKPLFDAPPPLPSTKVPTTIPAVLAPSILDQHSLPPKIPTARPIGPPTVVSNIRIGKKEKSRLFGDPKNLISIAGRLRRLLFAGQAIAFIALMSLADLLATTGKDWALSKEIAGVIILCCVVLFFISAIKRCHDFNKSGWWLILLVVPLLNFLMLGRLLLTSSDESENDYGPAP